MSSEKLLIAVVDDEENVRRALERLFRSAGMCVEMFPSGAEFLEALKTREPDCVVLDLHMPGVNGFEVQARLTEAASSVPVVVITGHDTEESRCRALGAGAFAYLRKPVDDEILLHAISAAVEKQRTERKARL